MVAVPPYEKEIKFFDPTSEAFVLLCESSRTVSHMLRIFSHDHYQMLDSR